MSKEEYDDDVLSNNILLKLRRLLISEPFRVIIIFYDKLRSFVRNKLKI